MDQSIFEFQFRTCPCFSSSDLGQRHAIRLGSAGSGGDVVTGPCQCGGAWDSIGRHGTPPLCAASPMAAHTRGASRSTKQKKSRFSWDLQRNISCRGKERKEANGSPCARAVCIASLPCCDTGGVVHVRWTRRIWKSVGWSPTDKPRVTWVPMFMYGRWCRMTPGYEQEHMLSKCGAPDGPVFLRISIQDMSVLSIV